MRRRRRLISHSGYTAVILMAFLITEKKAAMPPALSLLFLFARGRAAIDARTPGAECFMYRRGDANKQHSAITPLPLGFHDTLAAQYAFTAHMLLL